MRLKYLAILLFFGLFGILILPQCSTVRHVPVEQGLDTLKKYSYLLALCNPKGNSCFLSGMSTAFFIKHDKTVYLVSAYHVLTQTNSTSNKQTFFHRRAIVRLHQRKDDFVINLEDIRANSKKISVYNTPDIFFYKTNLDPDVVNINSIESFLKVNNKKYKTTVEAASYGYLNKATDTTNIYAYQPIEYKGKLTNTPDVFAYPYFANIDSLHLILQPKTYDGTSGSPVFLKYKDKKHEWIEFGGIMVATDSTTNRTVVLRREFIISEFERQTKSRLF